MLEFFRQHIGGMFGIIIVGLLAVAFAFSFGAQSRGWGKAQSEQYAATVNGTDIPERTLNYAFNLAGGRQSDYDQSQRRALQRSVLEGLVERQLLVDAAEVIGVSASANEAENRIINNEIYLSRPLDELARQIATNMFMSPAMAARILVSDGHRVRQSFKDQDGNFDIEGYQKFVRYYLQVPEEEFVEQQRLELIAERMRQIYVSGIHLSESEVRAAYERENDTASIEYVRFAPSYFADQLTPTSEELEKWAAEHADEIKQYYETNKFRYTNLEKMVRAQHILIKVAEDASDEERAKSKKEIEDLLTRIRAGEDFAELAREYSEDPGSAAKGGDLGFTPRGRMVPEFDEAMFAAKPGEVTEVVKTKYGYHIIKVLATREGNISLAEATPEIAETLYRRAEGATAAESTAQGYLARLKAGSTFAALIPNVEEKAASHLVPKVRTSRPFSSSATSIPGIGEAPEIVQASFELSKENPAPDKVFKIRDDYYLIRLLERKRPSDADFAEKKVALSAKLLAVKQAGWLRDQVDELKSRAEREGRIAMYFTPAAGQQASAQDGDESPVKELPSENASKSPPKGDQAGSESQKPAKSAETPAPAPPEPPDEEAEDLSPEDDQEPEE